MQFILYKSNNEISKEKQSEITDIFTKESNMNKAKSYKWLSNDNKTFFMGLLPDVVIYKKYYVFNNFNNNLRFINGWAKDRYEDKLLYASKVPQANENNLDGTYNIANLTSNGKGVIYNSIIAPNLYYAKDDNSYAVSNELSALSKVYKYTTLNKEYLAKFIKEDGDLTFDTMYENVYYIPNGYKILIEDELIFKKTYDFCYNDKLSSLYESDPKEYWNNYYSYMESQVKAFAELKLEDYVELDQTNTIYSMIFNSLYQKDLYKLTNLKLDTAEIKENKNIYIENLSKKTTDDLEVSLNSYIPMDDENNITLDTNIHVDMKPYEVTANEDVFDKYTVFKDEIYNKIESTDSKINDKYQDESSDSDKYYITKRLLSSTRSLMKNYQEMLDTKFIINPLLTNTFIKYAYNASKLSINDNEILYETLNRINPKLTSQLIELPMKNDLNTQIKLNNTLYFYNHFDIIKKYIKDNYDLISELIEESFINTINKEDLKFNIDNTSIINNILQVLFVLNPDSCEALFEEIKTNEKLLNKIDEYDNPDVELLDSYMKLNNDFISLKMDNNRLAIENTFLREQINQFIKKDMENDLTIVSLKNKNAELEISKSEIEYKMDNIETNDELNRQKHLLAMKNKILENKIYELEHQVIDEDTTKVDVVEEFTNAEFLFELDALLYSSYISHFENINTEIVSNSLKLNCLEIASSFDLELPKISIQEEYVLKLDITSDEIGLMSLSYLNNTPFYTYMLQEGLNTIYVKFNSNEVNKTLNFKFEKIQNLTINNLIIKKIG